MILRQEEMLKNGDLLGSSVGGAIIETEEDEGDIGEDERKMKRAMDAARD